MATTATKSGESGQNGLQSTLGKRSRKIGDLSGKRLFEDEAPVGEPETDEKPEPASKRLCVEDISDNSNPQKECSMFKLIPTEIIATNGDQAGGSDSESTENANCNTNSPPVGIEKDQVGAG